MSFAPMTDSISASFIVQMIPHHKGAVCMSENALHFPLCEKLKPQLEAIITSQKEGIKRMQSLLQNIEHCCEK